MTSRGIFGRAAAIVALGVVAACGAAQAAEITLYEHAGFAGAQLTLRGWTPDISRVGFNDRASSIVVTSGRWELCSDADFKGTCATFTRGEYPTLEGRLNDRISSAREVGSYGDRRGGYAEYGRGAVQLFSRPNFAGSSLKLEADAPSLNQSNFNDRAASLIVTQGTWELCVDDNFAGDCRSYTPGSYPELGFGLDKSVSSARLVRSANDAPAVISPGAPMPAPGGGRAILYNERGLRGASLAVSGPVADLERANFNDATASLYVESGTWVACRDSYFRGDCRSFGPGRYDDLGSVGFDRMISSIRPGGVVAAPPPVPAPRNVGLELFSEPEFGGEHIAIEGGSRDLTEFNDRTASAIVHAGTWEMCTDARFGGSCAVFRPGNYPRLGGITRQISSVRRIQ
ncbi:MAG: beta/gamma crystallin-related protein [Caldimonas sp.]